jgi:cyanate permease
MRSRAHALEEVPGLIQNCWKGYAMHLPTRRQERTATAVIAVIVIAVALIAAVVVGPELGGWILSLGILAVVAFVELTNWLISRPRHPR